MNDSQTIFLPLCAQVLLTLAVWIWLYVTRLGWIYTQKIRVQDLATRGEELLAPVVNPSDNFENLFEIPVLFFVAVLSIYVTGRVDETYVTMAWVFVAFRALHSVVHCSYNWIRHRFLMYIVSTFILWAMWIRFGLQILNP